MDELEAVNSSTTLCIRHNLRVLLVLKHAGERLVWGDPLECGTEIGPVIHTEKHEEHAHA